MFICLIGSVPLFKSPLHFVFLLGSGWISKEFILVISNLTLGGFPKLAVDVKGVPVISNLCPCRSRKSKQRLQGKDHEYDRSDACFQEIRIV